MVDKIRVAVSGISGRMGRYCTHLFAGSDRFELTAALGRTGASYIGTDTGTLAGGAPSGVAVTADLDEALSRCDVLLEFTVAETSIANARRAIEKGVHPVIGSSGLPDGSVGELQKLCNDKKFGGLVVPNFSVGAVLMMEFARQAGKYFGNVEIVEMHHTRKLDAPSGTAMHTIKKLAEANHEFNRKEVDEHELISGSRGGLGSSGVRVHSLRLPGLISHQEVIFGSPGELLTVRHDSFNTDCFGQGIMMALVAVTKLNRMIVGLDKVMGLGETEAGILQPAGA